MSMKSVYSVVNSFSGQALKEVKVSHYIKSKVVPLWSEILGKLSSEFTFEHVRYRQLYMSTVNPIWKTEIKYHESMIVQRLNERLPKPLYFKGIRVFYKEKKRKNKCVKDDQFVVDSKTDAPCVMCNKIKEPCVFCRLQ